MTPPEMLGTRPLSRYVVRAFLTATTSGQWSHSQDWWPNLHIDRAGDGSGTILFQNKHVANLHAWSGFAHNRDELAIVGSGPSIQSQRLDQLAPSSALLLNGAIHLIGEQVQLPLAVCIEDERFVWRHFDSIKRLVSPALPCFFSTSVLRALCELDSSWLADRKLFHLDFVERPYGRVRPTSAEQKHLDYLLWSETGDTAISLAPNVGLTSGGSVAVSALQIAVYLNPAKLGTAGIDLSNAAQPRFYESKQNMAKSGISQAMDRILSAFKLGQIECERRGIKLVNYSPVSALSAIGIEYDSRLNPS